MAARRRLILYLFGKANVVLGFLGDSLVETEGFI